MFATVPPYPRNSPVPTDNHNGDAKKISLPEQKGVDLWFYCSFCHRVFKEKRTLALHQCWEHSTFEERLNQQPNIEIYAVVVKKAAKRIYGKSLDLSGIGVANGNELTLLKIPKEWTTAQILAHFFQHEWNLKPMPDGSVESYKRIESINKPGTSTNMNAHGPKNKNKQNAQKPIVNRSCPVCNKVFQNQRSLIDHLNTHTGKRPYKCSVCHKGFAVEATMRVHERIHSSSKEKGYFCNECGKGFFFHRNLLDHLQNNHEHIAGEKRHKCSHPQCGKSFGDATALRVHQRLHSNVVEENHVCENCSSSFSTVDELFLHESNCAVESSPPISMTDPNPTVSEEIQEMDIFSEETVWTVNAFGELELKKDKSSSSTAVVDNVSSTGFSKSVIIDDNGEITEVTTNNLSGPGPGYSPDLLENDAIKEEPEEFDEENEDIDSDASCGDEDENCYSPDPDDEENEDGIYDESSTAMRSTGTNSGLLTTASSNTDNLIDSKVNSKRKSQQILKQDLNEGEQYEINSLNIDRFLNDPSVCIRPPSNNKPSPTGCIYCQNEHQCREDLRVHYITVHPGLTPFYCQQCPQHFADMNGLQAHIAKQHDRYRPWSCDQCPSAFDTFRNLKDHNNVHTGARPYKCDKCGKGFAQMPALRVHLRIHSGDKKFICDYCGIKFYTGDVLKKHLRKHTGEKPYGCGVCNVKFSYRSTLNSHMRTHDVHSSFVCYLCESVFSQKMYLDVHLDSCLGMAIPDSAKVPYYIQNEELIE